jgi:hypothetical protein
MPYIKVYYLTMLQKARLKAVEVDRRTSGETGLK